MSLFLFVCLVQVVSVMAQSTLLDSQCDSECRNDVEIQRLVAMMENMRRDVTNMKTNLDEANERSENKILELADKNELLQNQIVNLTSQLSAIEHEHQNHNDTINQLLTKITQLESEIQTSSVIESSTTRAVENVTASGMDSTTWNVIIESSTSEDCEDIRSLGYDVSGVYGVNAGNGQIAHVYCEMSPDGKTWTRILHRQDNLTDFTYKKWVEYEAGFGDPQGSHWMGLVQMHHLTTSRKYKMQVDLMDWEGETAYTWFVGFSVGPGSDKYRLNISRTWGGPARDSEMTNWHNNMMFSTIDQDNDLWPYGHCADGTGKNTGGWWYNICAHARLTGTYIYGGVAPMQHGIFWEGWRGGYYSYKVATMKIQRM